MSQLVLDTIKARRSCRKYKSDALPDEVIAQIVEAGQHAPSGGNNQTTRFTVISNRGVLDQIALISKREFAQMDYDESTYSSLKSAIVNAKNPENPPLLAYNAPVVIMLSNKKGYGNAMADCCCALENMAVAATALGIGNCYINSVHWLDENRPMRDYLESIGLPEDETLCCSLSLGFSDEGPKQPLARKGNPVEYIR